MERAKLKQNILISVFVVVVLVSGYLYYSNFMQKPKAVNDFMPMELDPNFISPINPVVPNQGFSSRLKTNLLSDPRFANLKVFGNVPIEVGTLGKDNPFIPYEGYREVTNE